MKIFSAQLNFRLVFQQAFITITITLQAVLTAANGNKGREAYTENYVVTGNMHIPEAVLASID